MKNKNNQIKKWTVVTGCLIVCLVLAVLIGFRLRTEPDREELLPSQGSLQTDTIVQVPTAKSEIEEKEVVVTPSDSLDSGNSNEDITDTETNQTIQDEVEKAEYTKEELTNPTQKPDGEKVTEPPKSVDHDKVEKPKDTSKTDTSSKSNDKKSNESKSQSNDKKSTESKSQDGTKEPAESKPQGKDKKSEGGESKDGKIYVPGFGWIDDEGGGGQGTTIDGDGDIDKEVGSMN